MSDAATGSLVCCFTECVTFTLKFLYYIITGSIKACLPMGILPRKSVKDDIVLITGAGNGMGQLMSVEFAKLGAKVVLWDISEKGNAETKAIIDSMGIRCFPYKVDISNRKEIYETAERVRQEVGDVDIVVNNAGIVTGKTFLNCPDEMMERTMAINTNALFWTGKAFIPKMLEKNRGHIVTMASLAGHIGAKGMTDYCASKHGAVGFMEALAADIHKLGKDGVKLTTVNPYFVNTGMFDGVKTYSELLFPILQPDYVVSVVMEAVLTEKEAVFIPKAAYIFNLLKSFLPTKAVFALTVFFGLHESMNGFVGRSGQKKQK